jgi:hypothetical protein
MTKYTFNLNAPEISKADLTGVYALFLSIVRFAVEKYGATMDTDPETGATYIGIPDWADDVCHQELWELLGPGKPLTGFLPFIAIQTYP